MRPTQPFAFRFRPRAGALALGAFLVAAASLAASPAAAVCGDVNGSGTVTAGDALVVLKKAVGLSATLVCSGDCATLEPRVSDLETALASTEAALSSAQAQLATTTAALASVQGLLAGISRTQDTLVLSGMNLQVVDGAGGTAGPVNGLGNVIIGYDEATAGQSHAGSHNLVLGAENEYTSFGGIVAGESNTISARGASVLGGKDNVASELFASVLGGQQNTASAQYSTVAGGSQNTASGTYAAVAGGFSNEASGTNSAIAAGCENTATNLYAAICGGRSGVASGQWSSVTGGFTNKATGTYTSVSGGSTHTSSAIYNWRAGSLLEAQ